MMLALGTLLGGVGLFLIGMMHLTDGLKQSAGDKLEYYLNQWTNTKRRGFASGFLLTALVQSSSVITVATIGFVNARLLTMGQAVWVVFGSNVGTTMTAWIVAMIGFKIKVELFALPLVGIGAFLHILSRNAQWKALGGAVVGFGLLFVGLDFLQSSMEAYKGNFTLLGSRDFDFYHVVMLLGMGFLLTVIMQSSSASMAMILTLVNAQVIPLELGAAAVIGANIGTTSTALLATIGATPNAKRVAWAHVAFNLVAAFGALLMLPLVSEVFSVAYEKQLMGGNAAFWLAIYHSLFNLFGVLIMIPFEPRVTRFLEQRFQRKEATHLRLLFLDKNTVNMPPIALQSISKELDHLAQLVATHIARSRSGSNSSEDTSQLFALLQTFDSYVVKTLRQPMAEINADAFSKIIKCSQSLVNALQLHEQSLQPGMKPKDPVFISLLARFEESYTAFINAIASEEPREQIEIKRVHLLEQVDQANMDMFAMLRQREVSSADVSLTTQWVAHHRRIALQMMKVLQRADEIDELLHGLLPYPSQEQQVIPND